MNRNTRTFVVLAVAIVVAGAASFGVYRGIRAIPERRVEIATKHAVVAAGPMPIGTLLTRESVKLVPWPAQTPLHGGFSTIDEVTNRGLIASVVENEPLTDNKLAAKEAGAGLPPTITPGMRAISVKVNEVIGVAGFVVPGTRVDVVTVISDEKVGDDGLLSRVVVSNVQVLSAGTRYDQEEPKKEGKAIRSTVVTLMVSPIDAERVALAQAQGQLMLTLRNPLDVAPSNTEGIRRANLFIGATATPAPSAPRPSARPAPVRVPTPVAVAVATPRVHTVETIRAAKRTEEVVGQ
jgi:pilus assembly protein CpaB